MLYYHCTTVLETFVADQDTLIGKSKEWQLALDGSRQQRVQEVPAFGLHFAREHRRVSASIDSMGGFID